MASAQALLPLYHIVNEKTVPHIRYLYRYYKPEQFEQQLDFFLKYWKPVDYLQLKEYYQEGSLFHRRVFHLSFDDGLKECIDIIAPILKRKGVPATFFIHSATLHDPHFLFYRYKLSLLIWYIRKNRMRQSALDFLAKNYEIKIRSVRSLVRYLHHKEVFIIDHLMEHVGFDIQHYLSKNPIYMNKEDIKKLIAEGHQIGGHSLHHIHFRHLSFQEQWDEFEKDILCIQETMQLREIPFAFPFGDDHIGGTFFEEARKQYPHTIFFGCRNFSHDTAPNILHRVPMENFPYGAKKTINNLLLIHMIKRWVGHERVMRK